MRLSQVYVGRVVLGAYVLDGVCTMSEVHLPVTMMYSCTVNVFLSRCAVVIQVIACN